MEIWKKVVGFEGTHEVSNTGKVKTSYKSWVSVRRGLMEQQERILSTHIDKDGYEIVWLWVAELNAKKRYKVHRLVASAFLPNPENKPQVNHKNGIKNDNNVANLEWATIKENVRHAYRTGLKAGLKGDDHPNSKLVLNELTGIYYTSVPEAAASIGGRIGTSNLYNQLSGYSPNKTPFKYV